MELRGISTEDSGAMDVSSYVSFAYINKDIPYKYLRHYKGYVKVYCSDISLVELVYYEEYLVDNISDGDDVTGAVFVIIERNLFSRKINRNEYFPDEFTPKTSKMYIPGVSNNFIRFEEKELFVTHYPFPCISLLDRSNCTYYSVVIDSHDAILSLKNGIKKVLSQHYYSNGIYNLHAAGFSVNNESMIFIAPSRTGKTTFYNSMLAEGAMPINDDIIFVKESNEGLVAFGIPVLPTIRKSSIPYLSKKALVKQIEVEGDVILLLDLPSKPTLVSTKIATLFYMTKGDVTAITENILVDEVKKILVESMMWHMPINPNYGMVNMVNRLLSCSQYGFSVSTNVDENISKIKKYANM